ncbi:MAG TPA: hypothetical protein VNA17_01590 [Pyrinomonadaceae bacterium]|nr:hypothetical protein [Pyrinomonadaceae bacterium]
MNCEILSSRFIIVSLIEDEIRCGSREEFPTDNCGQKISDALILTELDNERAEKQGLRNVGGEMI